MELFVKSLTKEGPRPGHNRTLLLNAEFKLKNDTGSLACHATLRGHRLECPGIVYRLDLAQVQLKFGQ